MSIWRLVPVVAALLLCTSCDFARHRTMMKQGCYYYDDTPIFKIANNRGTLKVPGDLKSFEVTAYGDDRAAEVIFSPSFILNHEPSNGTIINMKYASEREQRQTVTSISIDPRIRINWAAYGDTLLYLGKPC